MRLTRTTRTVVVLSERISGASGRAAGLVHESAEQPPVSLDSERAAALAAHARSIAAVMDASVREITVCSAGQGLALTRQCLIDARPDMLVAEWPDASAETPHALALAANLNLPAVFLRWQAGQQVDRVLIPTNGGPHTLQQMWVARALAPGAAVPRLALRVLAGDPGRAAGVSEAETARLARDLAAAEARMARLECRVEARYSPDPVTGIVDEARPTDLVMLGAPNSWRLAEHFRGSLPDAVARRVQSPMAMLLAKRAPRVQLRNVFWEQTILAGVAPRNKEELLALLVDALVREGQAPAPWRDHLLQRALDREAQQPTFAGHDTAFPHIMAPGFTGVVGCLAVCPAGVAFGPGGEKANFVFLLITPQGFYEGYLALMAVIARVMIQPEARRRLLSCDSPREVKETLDALGAELRP